MSQEGPKLYVNKPKKVQVIKHLREMEAQSLSSTPSSATGPTPSMGVGNGGASKPPEVRRESFARRYKFLWPLVLTVNLAIGAYVFMRTKKKDVDVEEEATSAGPSVPTPSPPPSTKTVTESPVAQPVRVLESIPEQQQRELFKWMLEERRKIKTKDPEEKKRIDEEKAILKQFIRTKSIPSF